MSGSDSHTYGTSPGNQRIEAWWSFYRRQHSQWWIDLFEALVSSGSFHPGNVRETDCLRFCFMKLMQQDLDEVRRQWNIHRTRPSAGATCPPGVPDELIYLPRPPATNQLVNTDKLLPDEVLQHVETLVLIPTLRTTCIISAISTTFLNMTPFLVHTPLF